MPTNKVLFQGYGPVDGPKETNSSIRSKLVGLSAPYLLVTTMAKHWGLRHRSSLKSYHYKNPMLVLLHDLMT
jgi:hypothetical protein